MPLPVQNSTTSHGINELFPRENMCVCVLGFWRQRESIQFFFFSTLKETNTISVVQLHNWATKWISRQRCMSRAPKPLQISGHKVFQFVSHPRNLGLKTTRAVAGSYKFWYCSWWQCPCNDWYCECWCTISQISKDKWKGLTSESKTQCTSRCIWRSWSEYDEVRSLRMVWFVASFASFTKINKWKVI